MDRRSFLKFLSAAPLAAPMVAASAAVSASVSAAGVLGVSGVRRIHMELDSSRWGDGFRSIYWDRLSQFDHDALTFNRGYLQTVQIADRIARTSELPLHNVLERSVQHALDIVSESATAADPETAVNPVAPPPASEGADNLK